MRYTSTPVECGHCHNKTIMVIGTSYSQVQRGEESDAEEHFERGDIYDVLECPVCRKVTLRKYFWSDYMESEADVKYHLLYPSEQDYTGGRENLFGRNKEHDAYLRIRAILQESTSAIQIIDPYIDGSIFTLLSTIPWPVDVKILTAKTMGTDFTLEARKFKVQHANITLEIRLTREFHDRFVILDGTKCYHLGASIKDAGAKVCMIGLVEDAKNVKALLLEQEQSWNGGSVVSV